MPDGQAFERHAIAPVEMLVAMQADSRPLGESPEAPSIHSNLAWASLSYNLSIISAPICMNYYPQTLGSFLCACIALP